MALQTHLMCSLSSNVRELLSPTLTIRSEKGSGSSDSAPKKTGVGFGPSNESSTKKEKGQRRRASIIRRSPVEKPAFVSEQPQTPAEQGNNETAFLLAWLGFGAIILVEGISLAASGFLPEEWDGFFVKYLYPSFTPTVFLFVAGAVGYGVFKFLQNEKISGQK